MIKREYQFKPSNEGELKISHNKNIDHKKYLNSLFLDERCEYFCSNTKVEILSKEVSRNQKLSFGIRYSNLEDLVNKYYPKFNGKTCLYFPEGLRIVSIRRPKDLIGFNMWTKFILAVGFQIYWLNPSISKKILSYYLFHFALDNVYVPKNENFVNNRLRSLKGELGSTITHYTLYSNEFRSKIESITNQILSTPIDEILPDYNSKVKVLYNPDYELDESQKIAEMNVVIGDYQTSSVKLRIENLVKDWDFRKNSTITKSSLAKLLGISTSTIQRNWESFKPLINKKNTIFKQEVSQLVRKKNMQLV